MRRNLEASCRVVLLTLPLIMVGCGSPDATSSRKSGLVKGKVTVAGKPLADAEVRFNPSNVNRKDAPVVTAKIQEDGTYELTTLVGQNQISLGGTGAANVPSLAYFTKTVDVQAGTNDVDITLP